MKLILFTFLLIQSVYAVNSYYVPASGGVTTINEQGVCQVVTNNKTKAIMVPTKSATEWSSFRTNLPSSVTLGSCCPGTGGVMINNACWYLGGAGVNCTTPCTNAGLSYDSTTQSYAGNTGTHAHCTEVLNALGVAGTSSTTAFNAGGCQTNGTTLRRGSSGTTAAAVVTGYQRACACSAADSTPNPVNWADFNDTSTTQTLNGFNQSITLQLSLVNNSGTPEVSYSLNGGAWTLFTSGAPASLSGFTSGSTLQFRVIGNVSDAATITVTNTSDSNAVLDTATGTVTVPADVTPDAIFMSDFDDISNTYTLTNFNHAIALEIAVSDLSGSPNIQYSLNSGTYTTIPSGSPAILSGITTGATLSFKALGTVGQSATITVTNMSDSLAVIGTAIGNVACSGFLQNGYCYYLGPTAGESCDTVCANQSGRACELTGTKNVSSGASCNNILASLGAVVGTVTSSFVSYACAQNPATNEVTRTSFSSATTCAASVPTHRRACACFIVDGVPNPVGWADFNDQSASQTFSGINIPISLSVSVANNIGTPDVWYRKNSGAWTPFTANPQTIAVSNTNTLEFQVLGNSGDKATLTVRNTSDSNTLLDTVAGTVTSTSTATPNAVDWAHFHDQSATQTLTGFSRALSIEITTTNLVGTPSIYYSRSGGAWTLMTSPTTLMGVVAGTSLQFKVGGTPGHAASFSVKNVSDSNTILDTFNGTVTCTGTLNSLGACIYLGSAGQSCDTVCGAIGKSCDLEANRYNAYETVCNDVMLALLGTSFGSALTSPANGWECAYDGTYREGSQDVYSPSVTCAATNAASQRACACSGGADATPNAVNWTNFNDASISQTISGITQPINLSVAVANNSGTPDFWYRKNGGTWTAFTANPQIITVLNYDALEFKVMGTSGNQGTLTITNASSGGAAIDTVVGTVTSTADGTPDAVDWANYNDASSVVTLTGFTRGIALNFALANGTGTPTVTYSLNSGTWTTVPNGSSVTIYGVAAGSTLQFKTGGIATYSGTVTVRNVSDGNVVLDTMVGTSTCGGTLSGGYCYYLSAVPAETCDTLCANRGTTCNLTGTQAVTTSSACSNILTTLGYPAWGFGSSSAEGCGYEDGSYRSNNTITNTTCAGTRADYLRVCSCAQ